MLQEAFLCRCTAVPTVPYHRWPSALLWSFTSNGRTRPAIIIHRRWVQSSHGALPHVSRATAVCKECLAELQELAAMTSGETNISVDADASLPSSVADNYYIGKAANIRTELWKRCIAEMDLRAINTF
eukprot:5615212-Amphidinium_carterae.1